MLQDENTQIKNFHRLLSSVHFSTFLNKKYQTSETTCCAFTRRVYIDWKKLLVFFIVTNFVIRELEALISSQILIGICAKGGYQCIKLHLLKGVGSF